MVNNSSKKKTGTGSNVKNVNSLGNMGTGSVKLKKQNKKWVNLKNSSLGLMGNGFAQGEPKKLSMSKETFKSFMEIIKEARENTNVGNNTKYDNLLNKAPNTKKYRNQKEILNSMALHYPFLKTKTLKNLNINKFFNNIQRNNSKMYWSYIWNLRSGSGSGSRMTEAWENQHVVPNMNSRQMG